MAFDLETAISTWRHQYKYNSTFKGRDLDELERHVRDHVEWLMQEGLDAESAFRKSVDELGNQLETESAFRKVAFMKTRDRGEMGSELQARLALTAGYLRVAMRNLKRNRSSSIVNVISLSVAVAVALVSFLFISNVLTRNNFHEHAKDLYLVHQVTEDGQWWGHSPMPLGPALVDSAPSLVHMTRVVQSDVAVEIDSDVFGMNVAFVDDDFLDTFTFPLASGTFPGSQSATDVVLSADTAMRLFGTMDAVGSTLAILNWDEPRLEVRVSGVAAPFPDNISFRFWMLMPMDARASIATSNNSGWDSFADATFLHLSPEADVEAVVEHMNTFTAATNAASDEWKIAGYTLDEFLDLTGNRDNVRQSVIGHIPWAPVVVLSTLAALLLLLACVNFMNITLATSVRRFKEIGVRKVIGGQRRQIVSQFLVENLELCVVAVGLGVFLAWVFVLPAFNQLANLSLEISLLTDWRLWLFLGVLIVGMSTLSGAYPAWYVTSFRPTTILKGRLALSRRRTFSHGLQAFQFIVTALALFAGTTLYMNAQYHAARPLGYDAEDVVNFETDSRAELDILTGAAAQLTGVEAWTTTGHAVGYSYYFRTVDVDGDEMEFMQFDASDAYVRLLDIPLASGQYNDASGADGVVINEAFAREAGMEDATGSSVLVDGVPYTVTGVVNDFHFQDFFSPIAPALFRVTPAEKHTIVTVRTRPGAAKDVVESMNTAYTAAFSQKELTVRYQDQVLQEFFDESGGITRIFLFVALLSMLISCLSIYALSTQNVVNRQKEIGIRKVLGGRSGGIIQVINRSVFVTLLIALLIAAPLGYRVLDILLDNLYAYRMDIGVLPMTATVAIVAIATLLTLSVQIRSIQRTHPAKILRSE